MILTCVGCILDMDLGAAYRSIIWYTFLQSHLAQISKVSKTGIFFEGIIPTSSEICIQEIIRDTSKDLVLLCCS